MSIPIIEPGNPYFKPLKDGWGIQPISPSPLDRGDVHDTFKVDKLGNIIGGHTTVRLPGDLEKRLDW